MKRIVLLIGLILLAAAELHAANLSPRGGGSAEAYEEIESQGEALTKRRVVNFTGAGVTCADDPGADPPRTLCTITNVPDEEDPTQPADLVATTVSTTEIDLDWTESTDNVAVLGYNVLRCEGADCTPTVEIDTDDAPPYSDTGLTEDTEYCYTVVAYDAADNESTAATKDCATTDAEGGTPAFVKASTPNSTHTGNNTRTTTFGTLPVVGNFVRVVAYMWDSVQPARAVTNVTDNQGNSYAASHVKDATANGIAVRVWCGEVATSSGTFTVTATFADTIADTGLVAVEHSDAACTEQAQNDGTATGSSAIASGSASGAANSLYIGAAAFGQTTATLTSGTWTERVKVDNSGVANVVIADLVGSGSQQMTYTTGGNTTWAAVIIVH
jgi:hypothetical protein